MREGGREEGREGGRKGGIFLRSVWECLNDGLEEADKTGREGGREGGRGTYSVLILYHR